MLPSLGIDLNKNQLPPNSVTIVALVIYQAHMPGNISVKRKFENQWRMVDSSTRYLTRTSVRNSNLKWVWSKVEE
jgi:hypothetical protein